MVILVRESSIFHGFASLTLLYLFPLQMVLHKYCVRVVRVWVMAAAPDYNRPLYHNPNISLISSSLWRWSIFLHFLYWNRAREQKFNWKTCHANKSPCTSPRGSFVWSCMTLCLSLRVLIHRTDLFWFEIFAAKTQCNDDNCVSFCVQMKNFSWIYRLFQCELSFIPRCIWLFKVYDQIIIVRSCSTRIVVFSANPIRIPVLLFAHVCAPIDN